MEFADSKLPNVYPASSSFTEQAPAKKPIVIRDLGTDVLNSIAEYLPPRSAYQLKLALGKNDQLLNLPRIYSPILFSDPFPRALYLSGLYDLAGRYYGRLKAFQSALDMHSKLREKQGMDS